MRNWLISISLLCYSVILHANPLDEVNTLYQQNSGFNLSQWSAHFVGKPYYLDALGEGDQGEFDRHPLFRVDAFDCLTYVETVMALSLATNANGFAEIIQRLRYKNGMVSFFNRNHFTSTDWNKNNIAQGYLQDITPLIVSSDNQPLEQTLSFTINKRAWYKKMTKQRIQGKFSPQEQQQKLQQLRNLHQQADSIHDQMSFIPLASLFDAQAKLKSNILQQLPNPTILQIVRQNWPRIDIGTDVIISHLGFAIQQDNGEWIYRHASSRKRAIVDQSLQHYLSHLLRDPNVLGIAVFTLPKQAI